MWSDIKKLHGSKQRFSILTLIYNNQPCHTPSEVSNILAESYSHTSSHANYDETFKATKFSTENSHVDFLITNDHPHSQSDYHQISETEISHSIDTCSKTSVPGVDQITTSMLKHLHHNSITHLTSIFNRIFRTGSFPLAWKIALVIPILKPLKYLSLPSSYRPISLLNTLSKILENRLSWFLEINECLAETQYGCRKKRSTLMALADLDALIYEAHSHNSHLFSIFFRHGKRVPKSLAFLNLQITSPKRPSQV